MGTLSRQLRCRKPRLARHLMVSGSGSGTSAPWRRALIPDLIILAIQCILPRIGHFLTRMVPPPAFVVVPRVGGLGTIFFQGKQGGTLF